LNLIAARFMGRNDSVHQPVPHTCFAPAIEAVEDSGSRPVTLTQINPERTGTQVMEDAVQNSPMINARHTARLVRRQRLDRLPLKLCQVISSMSPSPFTEIESFTNSFA
jgi:hypothetical protein